MVCKKKFVAARHRARWLVDAGGAGASSLALAQRYLERSRGLCMCTPAGLPLSALLMQQGTKAPAGPRPLPHAPFPTHLGSPSALPSSTLVANSLALCHAQRPMVSQSRARYDWQEQAANCARSGGPQWLCGWHSGALTIFQELSVRSHRRSSVPGGSKLLDGATARCRHVKDRVYSKRDRRTCERSVCQGRRRREGGGGERTARAEGGAHAERKGPGRAAGVRAGRGGEEGQEGAVELRGRSGAEIGRGRVPCSGSKTSDAGFTRARGDARRQDGRLRHPSCCTEVWAWRCRPLVTVEAPQRRSSLVSKYTRLRSVGAVAPWPRPPVAESCVVVSRRLMCRGAPNPCTSNTAHARRVQGRGPIAHCVWPPFFHHTWPAGQHVCARDSRRRICCAGGGQLSPRSRV